MMEKLDSSTHPLCIEEAGFSGTLEDSLDQTQEDVISEQIVYNDLLDKISLLENSIGLLKNENKHLRNQCLLQQEELSCVQSQLMGLIETVTDLKKATVVVDQNHNNIVDGKNKKQQNQNTETDSVLNIQMSALTADFNKLNVKFELFSSHINSISKTLYRLDSDVQKFVKKHSLIIENLCPKEDISAMEMLLVFVNSVLNVSITDSDIENLHIIDRSVGEKQSNVTPDKTKVARPRPLLVTFTCYKTQSQIYKSWLSFRSKSMTGSLSHERGQGITIKEYLTEQQEEIYNQALKLKEEHLVADCWTYKGKSYIKKLSGDVSEFCNRNEIVPKTENSSCLLM